MQKIKIKMKNTNLISIMFIIFFITPIIGNIFTFTNIVSNKYQNENVNDFGLKTSGDNINITTPENRTYTAPMNGYYPATHGFESDTDGTFPVGWIDTSQPGCSAQIIPELGGHKKVFEFNDNDYSNQVFVTNLFNEIRTIDGDTIEFWWRTSDSSKIGDVRAYDSGLTTIGVYLQISNGYYQYWDGVDLNNLAPCGSNVWYHHKIVISFSTSTFNWYIDGNLLGTNLQLFTIDLASFVFSSTNVGSGHTNYLDAISYSWDPDYTIGDNMNEGLLLSYENSTVLDWTGYSLDGAANITIQGTTTIPMPTSDGLHSIQVFGNETSGIMHTSDIRYFTTSAIGIITPENRTYTAPMSGYYPATHGFENDVDGLDPVGFTAYEGTGCSITVLNSLGGHQKVVELYDGSSGDYNNAILEHNFSPKTIGTVEFWFRRTGVDEGGKMRLWNNLGTIALNFREYLGWFQYENGTDFINIIPRINDQWYHIRFDFNTISDTVDIYIDNVLRLDDQPLTASVDSVTSFKISTNQLGSSDYSSYVDAIGYSWDPNYNIGDNINEGLLLNYENSTVLDWMGYSLDGAANITIQGTTTIPMPTSYGLHSIQVFGNETNGIMHTSDIRYFTTSAIGIITPENRTYTSPMSGYYPATHGFENDNDGTNPKGWIISEPGLQQVDVISSFNGHNKVLRLFDTESGGGAQAQATKTFSPQTTGSIEFWYLTSGYQEMCNVRTCETYNTIAAINFCSNLGNFWYENGTDWISIATCNSNQWYHVKFEFNCSTDTYDIFIEDNLILNDAPFSGSVPSITTIEILTRQWGTSSDYYMYIDALGLSWDPDYAIGDNLNEGLLLSYENSTVLDWVGYSLDGAANITIQGTTTMPMPISYGLHSIQVFGNETSGIMHTSDTRYFTTSAIGIISPANRTYIAPMNGFYPATYGFENDLIGCLPQDWTSDEIGGTSSVIYELQGHKYVLEMNDTNSNNLILTKNFTEQVTGTIEFWLYLTDTNLNGYTFRIDDSGTSNGIYLLIRWNELRHYPTASSVKLMDYNFDNEWKHWRIEWDCTDDWHLWIDGVSIDAGIGYSYWLPPIAMDGLLFSTPGAESGFQANMDGFGFSWDQDYSIGDNINEGLFLGFENSTVLDWMGYSLDGTANISIQGNTTIPMPDDGHHTIQVSGNSTGGIYYQSDVRHFTVKNGLISIKTPKNITYTTPMNGYYPATYGFENDQFGDLPLDWIDWSGSTCTVGVIDSISNFNKILEFNDPSSSGRANIIQPFQLAQSSGTVEFWVRATTTTNQLMIAIFETNAVDELYIQLSENGYIRYFDTIYHDITTYEANKWYHFRVEFDTTSDWHLWIDGISQDGGAGYNFRGNPTSLNTLQFYTGVSSGSTYYIDAIGYSWDLHYNIGDNLNEGLLLSFENSTVLDWMGYSLDGAANITIQGNTTIPMPTGNGLHSIQVFGTTPDGYTIQSDKRYFSLDWEYIYLRPSLNILDIIDEYGLHIEINLNEIGFLHVSNFSFTIPIMTDLGYGLSTMYFYSIDLYSANFVKDESILMSITIRFYYDPLKINDPSVLKLYHYVSSLGQWRLEGFVTNLMQNYVELTTTDLSYFCLTEIDIPVNTFPWLIIIIIILSAIGISIPSSYVIISRRKKNKGDKYKSLRKREHHAKELPTLQDEKSRQVKTVKPQITPEMLTPIKPRELKSIIKVKKPKKAIKTKVDDPTIHNITLSKKEIEEVKKTEKEMRILNQEDFCQVHKGPLTGMTYICPKCKAKYCVKCATSLSQRKEGCWVCDTIIKIESNKQESKPQNKKTPLLRTLDNSKLKEIFKSKNITETIENIGDINISILDKEFLKKVNQFKWEENEKQEFINEMIALPPSKREKILNRMIKLSKYKED
ncbi:MAG: hypothetical protein ACFFBP_06225 [Promethearchaeota archaeon]